MFVARSWSQRGENTSHHHFFNFFPGSVNITNTKYLKFDNIIYRKLKRSANHDGYSSLSVALEWEIIKKSFFHKPKIIHFWFADHDYHYSILAARLTGAKLIGNFFFSIEEFERRMPNKNHLKHLDLITASGKKQMEYLADYFPREKIVYLPLGIDTEFFHPPLKQESRVNPPVLLHVGNNRRDFKTLRYVFLLIQKQIPDIRLELVGGASTKYLFKNINNVKFHPFVTDTNLVNIYQRASVLLLPLLEGGSSQTLNEAMATGLPIETNALPNLEDYISKEGVLLSPKGDVDAMAEQCIALLQNSQLWRDISSKVREQSKQFDFKEIRKKLIGIYRDYLGFDMNGDRS